MDTSLKQSQQKMYIVTFMKIGFIAGLLTLKRVTDMPIPKETAVCVLCKTVNIDLF